jgi:hypothetical protein
VAHEAERGTPIGATSGVGNSCERTVAGGILGL